MLPTLQAHSARTALLELMDRNTALDQKLRAQNHRAGLIIRDLQERAGIVPDRLAMLDQVCNTANPNRCQPVFVTHCGMQEDTLCSKTLFLLRNSDATKWVGILADMRACLSSVY
jgi:hypothetical protein